MGDNGESEKPRLNAISAAARIGAALIQTSEQNPLTVCDLAMVIAGVCRYEWQHQTQPFERAYYKNRVGDIITSLSVEPIDGRMLAEGKRHGKIVYFLLDKTT